MEQKFTIAVIVAVVCAALAGFFGYSLSKAAGQNRTLEEQVTTFARENTDLRNRLDQLTVTNTTLQSDCEGLKAEYEALQAKHGKPGKAATTQ
jgi:predicted component of type VI protein secretion system